MSMRRSFVLLAFAFLLVTAPVFAGVGFQPVSPDELKMTSDPAAPGVPAIILYREVARYDDRVPHEDNYFRIKILKEEGRKYGDIEIPFYKERDEDISGIKARTIRPDGTIAEFHGQVFEKFLVKRRGDGRILAKRRRRSESLVFPDKSVEDAFGFEAEALVEFDGAVVSLRHCQRECDEFSALQAGRSGGDELLSDA